MSKQPNPKLIGSFALGGIGLFIVFIIIITGDALFSDRQRYVMYFDGSINGLAIGSNVMFRGVPVGFVSGIEVLANVDENEFAVPVYVDINSRAVKGIGDLGVDSDEVVQRLIDQGLRASLNTESLITGKLFVQLDFLPETEPVYRHQDDDLREVPTVPSGIQALVDSAKQFMQEMQSNVDFPRLAANLANAIQGLDELANSQDLRESLAGANQLLNSAETQRLSADLTETMAALRATLSTADTTLEDIRSEAGPLIDSLEATLASSEEVLSQAAANISDQSGLNYQLVLTLRELETAARSVRVLAEYLERDPQAIVRGRIEE